MKSFCPCSRDVNGLRDGDHWDKNGDNGSTWYLNRTEKSTTKSLKDRKYKSKRDCRLFVVLYETKIVVVGVRGKVGQELFFSCKKEA
jgi:hypothetical protein